jgi:hypothetical protein
MWYVHWVDFNRRNDMWIDATRINFDTSKEQLKEVSDVPYLKKFALRGL